MIFKLLAEQYNLAVDPTSAYYPNPLLAERNRGEIGGEFIAAPNPLNLRGSTSSAAVPRRGW